MDRVAIVLALAAFVACGGDLQVGPDAAAAADAGAAADAAPADATSDATSVDDAVAPDAAAGDGREVVVDAPSDGPGPLIVEVACAGATVARTITTSTSSFSPAQAAIIVGQIVRFDPGSPHDARAGTPDAPEPWFQVFAGEPRCYRFEEAGTFPFFCQVHSNMTGTIVVSAP